MSKILTTHFWKDLWYQQVATRINPRQKWLTDKIPRTWLDPDYIIETCVFESLIHFWEEDRGEETVRFQWECPYGAEYGMSAEESVARKNERKVVYDRLLAAYNWAKHGRVDGKAAHKKAIDIYYGQVIKKYPVEEGLRVVGNLEEYLRKQDDFFLKEIVELRGHMWS